MSDSLLKFDDLVTAIRSVNQQLAFQARQAVNVSLTIRNWLIGHYISEYLLHGADRAGYGEKAVPALAERLRDVSNCNRQELYRYLTFSRCYPGIVGTLSRQFKETLPFPLLSEKVGTVSALLQPSADKLVASLSYSHFNLLIQIENPEARAFYETECLRGNWSVRELKRQIGSLYYERTGLSRNPSVLAEQTGNKAETMRPSLNIHKNEMTAGDNPPIGILLCTGKNNALVEYALAGLDQRLFVSKYLLELPPKETMEAFLRRELDEISPPEGGDK